MTHVTAKDVMLKKHFYHFGGYGQLFDHYFSELNFYCISPLFFFACLSFFAMFPYNHVPVPSAPT